MSVRRRTLVLLLLAAAGGCAPAPWALGRGASLATPGSAAAPIPVAAWVAHVGLDDPTLSPAFADAMTLSLRDYLEAAHLFRDVALLGRPEPGDVVLRLVVVRYAHEEAYDPAYLPLYVLTLRLYALFGGTRTIETQSLSARLELARGSGTPIGSVEAAASDRTTHTFYRFNEERPDAAALRTRVVEDLLDRARPFFDQAAGG